MEGYRKKVHCSRMSLPFRDPLIPASFPKPKEKKAKKHADFFYFVLVGAKRKMNDTPQHILSNVSFYDGEWPTIYYVLKVLCLKNEVCMEIHYPEETDVHQCKFCKCKIRLSSPLSHENMQLNKINIIMEDLEN